MTDYVANKPIRYLICPHCARFYPPFLLARHVRGCQGVTIAAEQPGTPVASQTPAKALKTAGRRE